MRTLLLPLTAEEVLRVLRAQIITTTVAPGTFTTPAPPTPTDPVDDGPADPWSATDPHTLAVGHDDPAWARAPTTLMPALAPIISL